MLKRAVSAVLILVLVPHVTGCTGLKAVDLTDVELPVEEKVYGVITLDGERVDFDEPSTDVRNDTIYATVDESPYAIGLDQVRELRLLRADETGIVIAGVIVATLVVLGLWLLTAPKYD